jgi:hypothetical protein
MAARAACGWLDPLGCRPASTSAINAGTTPHACNLATAYAASIIIASSAEARTHQDSNPQLPGRVKRQPRSGSKVVNQTSPSSAVSQPASAVADVERPPQRRPVDHLNGDDPRAQELDAQKRIRAQRHAL